MADETRKADQSTSGDADASKMKDLQPKSVSDSDADSVKGGLANQKWAKKDV